MSEYTGKGICVAVLDTGIYPHMDFDKRIIAFKDFVMSRKMPYDDNGHGTHVTGILAGNGKASNGRYIGAAPDCELISLKVLDRMGNGNKTDVLKAFDWIYQNYKKYHIRIINISVGTTYRTKNEQDRLIKGVEKLWDEGIIVVTAAGNQGPVAGSITAPGCSKKVITVGSSDLLDGINGVSGRGPTEECVCKPDIVAPGNRIISCLPGVSSPYGVKSGTSMSTPYISGYIARLLEKDSTLTNVEIKMLLKDSADDLGLPMNIQGWGKFNSKKFLNI